MDDRSDESLVTCCWQGDKNAYASLVKRYYRIVFAVCLGVLGNVHNAEDIAQDAMLRGFLKIQQLRNGGKFETWILRIAKNLCFDFARRQKRIKPLSDQVKKSPGEHSENLDLQQSIRRLPLELREPLVMYYFDGKSTKIIGEKLGISPSGICRKIRKARKELHILLSEGDER